MPGPTPASEALPFRFVERIAYPGGGCPFLEDVDGDHNDDLLLCTDIAYLRYEVRGTELVCVAECNFRHPGEVVGNFDASGDKRPEFFAAMRTAEGILLSCHDWFSARGVSTPAYTLGPFLAPHPHDDAWPEGAVRVENCFDADRDGRAEIYVSVIPYHARPTPRSLSAYDGDSGEHLWTYEMGPGISGVELLSLPDGDARILVATWSPANGASWNGTSDTLSYVFCLTPRGELAWLQPIAGCNSAGHLELADLDQDGVEEILIARRFGPQESERDLVEELWSVASLDRSDGHILKTACLHAGVRSVHAVDLNRDLVPEILAVGMDGRLFILDRELSTKAVLADRCHIGVPEVVDLDRNGSREIVCRVSSGVVARDETGLLIAELAIPIVNPIPVAQIDDERYVVCVDEGVVRFWSLQPTPPAERDAISTEGPPPAGLLLVGAGAGSLGMFTALSLRQRRRQQRLDEAVSHEACEALLTAMTAFGHGGASLKTLDRIRFHLKNWGRPSSEAVDSPLLPLAEALEASLLPDLQRIVSLARRAGCPRAVWAPLVATAARGARRIRALVVEDGGRAEGKTHELVRAALDDLVIVDEGLAAIRRLLRRTFRSAVVATAGKVLASRRQELAAAGVETALSVEGAFEDEAFIAPGALEKIVDNLIMNAVRAIEGRDRRTIRIQVASEGTYLRVDVIDSGCGIARENWERVFDRDYSTKPGGGFGLHFARQELAKFGGRLFVHDSSEGGATLRMVLRVST